MKEIGRLVSPPRIHGKSAFVHIFDKYGLRQQLYCNKEYDTWELFISLNQGDIIQADGEYFLTKTGENTLRISKLNLIRKCQIGLPDKATGVGLALARENPYLNLISEIVSVDGETPYRDAIILRAEVLRFIREYLDDREYIEVQTPILIKNAFGCDAKPFQTEEYYLRIAPELELKKLIVGGFDRVYEIGKNFRNEGLSQKHNPEFTMLEFYCTYGDVNDAIKETKNLLIKLIEYCNDSSLIPNCKVDWEFSNEILNEFDEEKLINPTFVRPKEDSPLAKHSNGIAERFELYVDRMEIANGYSEQDDWEEQLKAFEAQGVVDENYINALKIGLPPTFGVGIGIDRLLMLLTNRNIKEVI